MINGSKNILTYVAIVVIAFYAVSLYLPILSYPITLLVTFLHEFGHSMGAILTGGSLHEITVNTNGSGLAVTSGGIRAITIMGGYIGSALFGLLFINIGLGYPKYAEWTLYGIVGAMATVAILYGNNLVTSAILISLCIPIYLLAKKTELDAFFLTTIGFLSLFHVIMDYNVGPTSDLAQFQSLFPILPTFVYMYAWLAIVLVISFYSVKRLVLKNGA